MATVEKQHDAPSIGAFPKVILIATGGTISGGSASSTDTTDYAIGKVTGIDLIRAIPEIANVAEVEVIQFTNVASTNLTSDDLLSLAKMANAYLSDDAVSGVVITHGTSTTEETGLFLECTVDSAKPVVIVGAMRPGTAISADGPLNLLQAISLAVSPCAMSRGVLLVSNDRIGSALYTSKCHTQAVDAFRSSEAGYLGVFIGTTPRFFYGPAKVLGMPKFDISATTTLPRVDILYSYQDEDPGYIDCAITMGAKGIVMAGTGNSTLSKPMEERVESAMHDGLPVIRASRTGAGFVSARTEGIASGFYNPQKARILLMLAINAGASMDAIVHYFIPA
jgi:L-asparaginase